SMEAEVSEDSQMILGDTLQRLANEPDGSGFEVVQAAEMVEQLAAKGISIDCIDRKIAPGCVFPPIVGKRDRRPASVGRHVGTQTGNFDDRARRDRGHRAMLYTGWHRLDSGILQ